jgi:hypothetical protein
MLPASLPLIAFSEVRQTARRMHPPAEATVLAGHGGMRQEGTP